jgi:L-galactose dehydrogenase
MKQQPLGNTDLMISEIAFGTAPLGNEYGETDPEEGVRAVHAAIDLEINCFDSSPYYGRNLAEQRLGAALKGRRHRVIIATKCGRYGNGTLRFLSSPGPSLDR